jgi:hypothetical protein
MADHGTNASPEGEADFWYLRGFSRTGGASNDANLIRVNQSGDITPSSSDRQLPGKLDARQSIEAALAKLPGCVDLGG